MLYCVKIFRTEGYDGYYGEIYDIEKKYCRTLETAKGLADGVKKEYSSYVRVTIVEAAFDEEGILRDKEDVLYLIELH